MTMAGRRRKKTGGLPPVDPDDVEGLVACVVGIERRLGVFRQRLGDFAGDEWAAVPGATARLRDGGDGRP